VQLTPKILISFNEIYWFSQLLQRKMILIDKIPTFLQAFKVVISAAMTEHSGMRVELLVTPLKDMAQNTQETFGWVSSTV